LYFWDITQNVCKTSKKKHNSIYLLAGRKHSFILLMIQIFYASHEFSIYIKYSFKAFTFHHSSLLGSWSTITSFLYIISPYINIYTTTGNQMAPIIFAGILKPRPLHQKKENRWSQVNHFQIRLCSLPNSQTLIRKVYFPLSQPSTKHNTSLLLCLKE